MKQANPIKILLIEDDYQDVELIEAYLGKSKNCRAILQPAETLSEGLECLNRGGIDIVLSDLSLPDEQGLDTFRQLYAEFPQVPIIILSGLDDEEVAVQALSLGAQDYLIKGLFNNNVLTRAIRYALERQQLRWELTQLNQNLEHRVSERTAELEQANERLLRLEAELRRSLAQEKELSLLKSRIITTISHEYRTPLTTIASSAELLEVYRHNWEDAKQLKHFHRIQSTVKHLTTLVNDVMFINKAEFEQLEFNPAPLNLATLVQELVDELRLKISDKYSLNFINIGDCQPLYLDAQVLRKIFTNLVSNAIKFSPDGGKVSVQLTCDNNHVIFSCEDEGIGIPKEDLNNLFDSFSRASNVGTIAGTGLGLSIVKKCVDLHGGQVSVESEVGVGTKFTVMLPLNPPV